jgi:predicted unusual protein kinase regulating ubiquinone biosynthesis (AarF/ABC1/UbiB family)/CubicO group peptidase (beta-lactamase class C family)
MNVYQHPNEQQATATITSDSSSWTMKTTTSSSSVVEEECRGESSSRMLPPPTANFEERLAQVVRDQVQKEISSSSTTTTTLHESSEVAVLLKNLQEQNKRLATRCTALEAQNILWPVHVLDILTQIMAWVLSLSTTFLGWRFLVWSISKIVPFILATTRQYIPSVENTTIEPLLAVLGDYNTLLSSTWNCASDNKFAWLSASLFYITRTRHGYLLHRRFDVFVIAFICMMRIRLARWRERTFIVVQRDNNERQATTRFGSGNYGEYLTKDAIWDANYEISARYAYVSILRLKGMWTKWAQHLGTRADFMPPAFLRDLRRLQDDAPATDWKYIRSVLTPKHFAELTDIDEKPVASASIGQVHTARLKKTGQKVAFKVQHPDARQLIMDDLSSMAILVRILAYLEPEYAFLEIVMREWTTETRKELDYLAEAENLRAGKAALAELWTTPDMVIYTNPSNKNDKSESIPFQVEIPQVFDHLSNKDILVMSYCEGTRIDDLVKLKEWNIPREAVVNSVAQTFAHLMYTTEVFNADPHSGNLFIRPGTRRCRDEGFTLVVLDWGLAKRLPALKRLAFCQLVCAASSSDYGLLRDGFKNLGLETKDNEKSMEDMRFILRDMVSSDEVKKQREVNAKSDGGEPAVPNNSKTLLGEFFFFVRVNGLIFGLASTFDINMSYLEILKPHAERGVRKFDIYKGKDVSNPPIKASRDRILKDKLLKALAELDSDGEFAGGQIYVVDKTGNTVVNVFAGSLGGLKSHIPMEDTSLILGFSCTKGITATLAHLMVDQGYLDYDEPICERVWPAFCPTELPPKALGSCMSLDTLKTRWAWKRKMTLRHILTHRAGMAFTLPNNLSVELMASCTKCSMAYEYKPDSPEDLLLPNQMPGEKSEYHFMSFGWLVAGTLCGAYAHRHGITISYEDLYNRLLAPKLSDETKTFGFRPCGGSGGHTLADIVTNGFVGKKMKEDGASGRQDKLDEDTRNRLMAYQGKYYLLDPRVWNCTDALDGNVPSAGGRFSAAGLAHFYHDLGSGRILDNATIDSVTSMAAITTNETGLQGVTTSGEDGSDDIAHHGLGYQLINFGNDEKNVPSGYGHAGMGGSIAFYHKSTGMSVGLMLNKADGGGEITKRILKVVVDHLNLSN